MKVTNSKDTITLDKAQMLEMSEALQDLTVVTDEIEVSPDWLNLLFIRQVYTSAITNLKPEIDPLEYSDKVLKEYWNGETYVDKQGRVRFHEIEAELTVYDLQVIIVGR